MEISLIETVISFYVLLYLMLTMVWGGDVLKIDIRLVGYYRDHFEVSVPFSQFFSVL